MAHRAEHLRADERENRLGAKAELVESLDEFESNLEPANLLACEDQTVRFTTGARDAAPNASATEVAPPIPKAVPYQARQYGRSTPQIKLGDVGKGSPGPLDTLTCDSVGSTPWPWSSTAADAQVDPVR